MEALVVVVVLAVVGLAIFLSVRRSTKRTRAREREFESVVNTSFGKNSAFQSQVSAAVADALAKASASGTTTGAGLSAAAVADLFAKARSLGTSEGEESSSETSVDRSMLGVAEVLSVLSFTGSPEAQLELDAIGAPKRRVTMSVPEGASVTRGDRLYVVLDSDDPSKVSLAPTSLTGGQTPPEGANRLDPLVLWPQILRAGDKAKGVVKSAEIMPLGNPLLESRGLSKWNLEIEVTPQGGWPYRAELTTTLSTPEKAARIAHAGAELPLRVDPNDPKTIAIDPIEMGYGDPSEALKSAGPFVTTKVTRFTTTGPASGHTVILMSAGRNKISVIKEVRELLGLDLKDAKDLVESAPQKLKDYASTDEAQFARQRLESAGATVVVV
ncbi:ribosomal protein L7/L12 [Paraburkholderia megapolitana]|uniref:50S ribosomal protein L7/L12 n=1 Tax=Paraburkholderia megapolitana TaxID=420953 RepID=A0A1I3GD09_9BURK|nr:ribosomal protein L7/L12 [Paraburkholderia megapolitana]SFI21284.1 ribosomal protein L7/L12 [Paraburkholderia megapolitana]